MKMIVLQSNASMVSSNATGSANTEYANGTTYAAGAKVKVSFESNGTTPRFPVVDYESLDAGNVGHYPPDNPTYWSDLGADNKSRMFDGYLNTQTVHTSALEVEVSANGANHVGLFGLYGTKVTLSLVHDSVVKKTETFDLRSTIPASGWYNWLYASYEYPIYQILWEFPQYAANSVLEITITTRSGQAMCGHVAIGRQRYLGVSQYDATIGIDDYSIKGTDSLGRTYLAQGAYAKRANVKFWLTNTDLDAIQSALASIRGSSAIFDCNNGQAAPYQALIICGYYSAFDIAIPGFLRSLCNIEIKGLI